MTIVRFDTILQSVTGIPADNVVNSWHFFTAAGVLGPNDYDNVRDMLKDFFTKSYTKSGVSKLSLAAYIPTSTITSTALVRAYILGTTPGAPPDYTSSFTAPAGSASSALPAEVALCLSYQAALEDNVNQARRRNRKYIGPFASNALGTNGRPSPGLIDTMTLAAREMLQAAQASVTWEWVGYSKTNAGSWEIDNGWVDNAWDTQRRRGPVGSSRQPWADNAPPE